MFFNKTFRATLILIISFELFSFCGYLWPVWNKLFFIGLVLLFLMICLKRLDAGVYILLAELFIGSKGYLFYYDFGGFTLSIRIAFWLIIMSVWFFSALKYYVRGRCRQLPASTPNHEVYGRFFKSKLFYYFLAWFSVISLGLVIGFVRRNSFNNIFDDFNAYLFFGLILVFYDVIISKEQVNKILGVFSAALVAMSLKTIGLLYFFSHSFLETFAIYKWVRTSGVGEITNMGGNYYRIFFQSHIFIIIGFVIFLVFLLFNDYEWSLKTFLKGMFKKKSNGKQMQQDYSVPAQEFSSGDSCGALGIPAPQSPAGDCGGVLGVSTSQSSMGDCGGALIKDSGSGFKVSGGGVSLEYPNAAIYQSSAVAVFLATTILISLSRSFWVGLIGGLIILFAYYLISESFDCKNYSLTGRRTLAEKQVLIFTPQSLACWRGDCGGAFYKKFIVYFSIVFASASYLFFIYKIKYYLGLFLAVLILFYFLIKVLKFPKRKVYTFVSLVAVSFLLGMGLINNVVKFPFPKSSVNAQLGDVLGDRAITISGDAATSSRWNLLKAFKPKIMEFPTILVGSGFGSTITYKSSDPRILSANPSGLYTTYAFEWGYLDIWLKLGIIGLAVYLALILKLFFQGLSYLKKDNWKIENDESRLVLGLLLGLIIVCVIHCFTPFLNHPLGIGYLLLCVVIFNLFSDEQRNVV